MARNKLSWKRAGICISIILLLTLSYKFRNASFHNTASRILRATISNSTNTAMKTLQSNAQNDVVKYIQQRNNISRTMNAVAHTKSILYCELERGKQNLKAVSETGGWCEQKIDPTHYNHVTDGQLVKALADFLAGKKVGSFGDGRGHYKTALDKTGKLESYDAYDGGPYYDKVSNGSVKYLDLTLPQYGLPLYDYVMSLEVAEHIPEKFESIYLSNIVRHAKEGIILSWAIPKQRGHGHVNLRPLVYVKKALEALGFDHDPEASKNLQVQARVGWLKSNINVYTRRPDSHVDLNDI